jgi:serine/threonine protein kinase
MSRLCSSNRESFCSREASLCFLYCRNAKKNKFLRPLNPSHTLGSRQIGLCGLSPPRRLFISLYAEPKARATMNAVPSQAAEDTKTGHETSSSSSPPSSKRQFEVPHVPLSDITRVRQLGTGSFSAVYQVCINQDGWDTCGYALKCLESSFSSSSTSTSTTKGVLDTKMQEANFRSQVAAAKGLKREIKVLSQLKHANIIRLHGTTTLSSVSVHGQDEIVVRPFVSNRGLILDLLEAETLETRLDRWRSLLQIQPTHPDRSSACPVPVVIEIEENVGMGKNGPPVTSKSGSAPSLTSRLETVAMGIIRGMEYLHHKNVLVSDLHPANIGFDATTGTVKIFNLGSAQHVHHQNEKKDRFNDADSSFYQAPEIVVRSKETMKPTLALSADIYSLGVLLWELCTLLPTPATTVKTIATNRSFTTTTTRTKAPNLENVHRVQLQQQEWRPMVRSIPSHLLRELIRRCCQLEPERRPLIGRVRSEVELKLFSQRPLNWPTRILVRRHCDPTPQLLHHEKEEEDGRPTTPSLRNTRSKKPIRPTRMTQSLRERPTTATAVTKDRLAECYRYGL